MAEAYHRRAGKAPLVLATILLAIATSRAAADGTTPPPSTSGDDITSIASDGEATQAVITRLDAMLPRPTVPLALDVDPSLELLDAVGVVSTRYVIVVRARSVHVADLVDRRVVSRVLEEDLIVRTPYAVALVAIELLEVVGAVVPEGLDDDVEAPPSRPRGPETPPAESSTVSETATSPAWTSHVVLHLGAAFGLGIGGDVHLLSGELGGGLERTRRGLVLGVGASARFPSRTRITRSTTDGVDVRFTYTRSDLALRGTVGQDFGRLAYRAHALAGPSRVRVRARTSESPPRSGQDTRATAFIGLALEGRLRISGPVFLHLTAGFEWLLGATPFGALGELLLDEPRYRIQLAAGLVWRLPG